jgi:hypothetical protein
MEPTNNSLRPQATNVQTTTTHGRPKTQYHHNFCQLLEDHMAQGFSFESFGAVVRVGRRTLYEWRDQYPEFADAYEIGTELALSWWENVIRGGYIESRESDKVNMKVVTFFLRNRFPSEWMNEKFFKIIQPRESCSHDTEHYIETSDGKRYPY